MHRLTIHIDWIIDDIDKRPNVHTSRPFCVYIPKINVLRQTTINITDNINNTECFFLKISPPEYLYFMIVLLVLLAWCSRLLNISNGLFTSSIMIGYSTILIEIINCAWIGRNSWYIDKMHVLIIYILSVLEKFKYYDEIDFIMEIKQ